MKQFSDKVDEFIEKLQRVPFFIKQQAKINTLKIENEVLQDSIKDELYKEFMKKLGEPLENERLKRENKRLRNQVKILKEIIKEGK